MWTLTDHSSDYTMIARCLRSCLGLIYYTCLYGLILNDTISAPDVVLPLLCKIATLSDIITKNPAANAGRSWYSLVRSGYVCRFFNCSKICSWHLIHNVIGAFCGGIFGLCCRSVMLIIMWVLAPSFLLI